jgi:uncharacterized iron-regulated membrane protein
MTQGQSWLRNPKKLWLRRAVFQVHLWSGIILGLYVVVVCVSGSAIVFRNDIEDVLAARTRVDESGKLLSREQLRQSVQRAYPDYAIRSIKPGRFASEAAEVTITRGWWDKRLIFDPYTGKDLGPSPALLFRCLRWLGDLHGNLLLGPMGLRANGIAGALVAVLCFSGLVVWWPGIASWRRSLWIRGNVGWKRLNWDLHSAFGFWTFALLLMWGLTGAYFPFPAPFRAVINAFTPIDPPLTQQMVRPQQAYAVPPTGAAAAGPNSAPVPLRRARRPRTRGQNILRGFSLAHYGNFAGWPLKVLWVILGFAPVVLFVTAMLMWWNRVLSPLAAKLLRVSNSESREAETVANGRGAEVSENLVR